MGYYDPYDQPDPEEERRKLEEMHRFAYGRDMDPDTAPVVEAMQRVDPPEVLDRDAPPDPDYERAAPILEGTQASTVGAPSPRELEDDAIRAVRDSYSKKRGFWEDAAPAAIALGVDALFNKSRGMGPIVGGFALGKQRQANDDRDSMRQMADLEIMRARETAHDAERAQNYEINSGNLKARNAENEEARARRLAKGSPENALSQSQANLNEARAYDIYANIGVDKNAPSADDVEYRKALTAESKARAAALNSPVPKADSPDLAYRKGRDEKKDAEDKAKTDKDAADLAELRQPFPGIKIRNQGLWDASMSDKVQRRRLAEGVGAYQSAWRGLERMKEIRAEHGTEVTKSAARGEYDTLANETMAAIGLAANAGVLQPSDIDRFKQQIPDLTPHWDDLMRLIPGHSDPSIESLRGTGEALRGSAGTKSRIYGFEYDPDSEVWLTPNQLKARQAMGGGPKFAEPPPPPPSASMQQQSLQYPVAPNGSTMPDDLTTPGAATLGPVQRLGPSGPSVRGTVGFPGGAQAGAPAVEDPRPKRQRYAQQFGVVWQ